MHVVPNTSRAFKSLQSRASRQRSSDVGCGDGTLAAVGFAGNLGPNALAAPISLLLFLAFACSCHSQVTELSIKHFGFANLSGATPTSLIVGKDGALYGTTSTGGTNLAGTVFRLSAGAYTQLHSFGVAGDGANPLSLVQAADGNLYGLTTYGGSNNIGTVFTLHTDGSAYDLIYQFNYDADGSGQPNGLAQGLDGLFYGTTSAGGSNYVGSVFQLHANGSGYTHLHHFRNQAGAENTPGGTLAFSKDGLLYGTTQNGGSHSGGTIFRLGTDGSAYSVIYSFTSSTGIQPRGGVLLGPDNALYGTAYSGGLSNYGTIFRVPTSGSGYLVLHHFTSTLGDGGFPTAPLVLGPDGFLYGATLLGGSLNDAGCVFKIDTDGLTYSVLYKFAANYPSHDGQAPNALALSAAGVLYGTTHHGGNTADASRVAGDGTVFAVSTNGGSFAVSDAVIYDFNSAGADGAHPFTPVLVGRDGALYGTTQDGGDHNLGTLFRLSSSGRQYSVLHSFGVSPVDGQHPLSQLIQGSDGALYGATSEGGYNYDGTVFKINPDGSGYALLHGFGFLVGSDGYSPVGMLQANDGALYGVTEFSEEGGGSIFRIETNGANYALVYEFSDESLGDGPRANLIQGQDGFLYGTTYYGGTNSHGVVFKISTNASSFVVLHYFGADPLDTFAGAATPLVQAGDGTLYGTTELGGTNNAGTIFKLRPDGTGYTVIYQFKSGLQGDGQHPNGLLLGSDGNLYGTTLYGGLYSNQNSAQGDGTLFTINTSGTSYTVLYNFGGRPNDGINPQAGLVQDGAGILYGTTSAGGNLGLGTVFRYGQTPLEFTAITRLPNGMVQLALTGASNTTCRIDASTDLGGWLTLTNLTDSTGVMQFLDQDASSFPKRFYRGFQSP